MAVPIGYTHHQAGTISRPADTAMGIVFSIGAAYASAAALPLLGVAECLLTAVLLHSRPHMLSWV